MTKERIKLNGGFHNDIFHDKENNKIVRISKGNKTKEMVMQEIEWIHFLLKNGVSVSKAILPLAFEKKRVKTIFDYIQGDSINVTNKAHWNEVIFNQLGKNLGKMHSLSQEYEIKAIHRPKWRKENPDVFNIRANLVSWINEKYEKLLYSLSTYNVTPDTFGLIHNDFHQGNLIINKSGIITTIDFDNCAYNWYAQDLAVAFYHAYWQHESFNGNSHSFSDVFMRNFFAGYQTENILHKDVIAQIPTFLKLREIYLYQPFKRTWDMDHLEKWQEYTLQNL
ncbi:phosphotransferase enzyme family protein [Bacillus cereus]|uniref:phosphotransferase enzyme family protein n=1 Tax=Bacillus cereus TaxID=1396 RepID=UPI003D08B77D